MTNPSIEHVLKAHIAESSISCRSLVVTMFGDVISQHGGWVWLGSLIDSLSLFGFNERSVRTAVYRLVQSDWLQVKKIGRKSYYCYTEKAQSHFERVARRMYLPEPIKWDGKWLLVMTVNLTESEKEEFKKSLLWLGFNSLTSGIFAHPSSDRRSLDEVLNEQKLTEKVAVFNAEIDDVYSQAATKELINNKWQLDELKAKYQVFLDFYRQLKADFDYSELNAQERFVLRVIIIHEYRRIILKDPDLPQELLPSGWEGYQAQDLLIRTYHAIGRISCDYVENHMENASGPLAKAISSYYQRFEKD